MKWSFVAFRNAIAHFVPTPLRDTLIEELKSRGGELAEEEGDGPWPIKNDLEYVAFDLGGCYFMGEPWVDVPLGDICVKVRAKDFDFVLDRIKRSEPRRELGRTTYKVHGGHHCLVLLPQQKRALVHNMEGMIASEEVYRVFDAFLVEWDEKRLQCADEEVKRAKERLKKRRVESEQARDG